MTAGAVVAPAEVDCLEGGVFAAAWEKFASVLNWLAGPEAAALTHGELETRLQADAREVFRKAYQGHLDLRTDAEERVEVIDADGVPRPHAETGHARCLATVFGPVTVERIAYRKPRRANLYPADAALNLPVEKHSHGLRLLAALEAADGSFESTTDAIRRATGQQLGKRQVEDLAAATAVDFEAFYAQRQRPPAAAGTDDTLVLSCDGKGVVMRPDALRPATKKAAAACTNKLATRLSKGEKRNRKRMAEVGAVYDAVIAPRGPTDILPGDDTQRRQAAEGPTTRNKWLTASVVDDAAAVVADIFDEASRRDPGHHREWVALVDGNNHQIHRITAEAKARGVTVTILCDFIHVLEYLWKAAWCFHTEGDRAAEAWVRRHAMTILAGGATRVAGTIRRAATRAGLDPATRAGVDTCATYLTNKHRYLDYPTALARGRPIATGVIEGACRHIVADRLDITGARWSLTGAEAILKLRAIRSNGDFDDYYAFHLAQEHRRNHRSRYENGVIPTAA